MESVTVTRYEPLFTIGLAAGKVNLSPMTLRMYERKGLILPYKTQSGRRYFSIHDLEIVLCVREMIGKHGLNIEGIRRVMSLIPCWDVKKCSPEEKKDCSAFTSGAGPCWSLPDSACRHNGEDCRECRVYRELPECSSLKKLLSG
jgi:MerR family transcriptional regulator/heat shock protein HspR